MAISILGKDVTGIAIDEKEVIRISDYISGEIIWEKVPVNYFYIQNTYSGTNTVTITSTVQNTPTEGYFTRTLQYSKDRRVWTTVVLEHQVSTTITLNQGEKVYFRNTNGKLNYDNTVEYFYTSFSASQSHIVGGNIESLVDYRNIGRINYQYSGTYSNLFRDDTTLTSASGLIMPENNLSASCMSDMFKGCTSLTDAPDLPATTLSKYCYQRMFAECSSLTETPELPATSVQDGVYWSMFRNCTSLVTTHDLELKVLTNDCYNNMFYGCTSLVDAPEIYAQVYGKNSCENMFRSCTSLSSMHVNADDATATDCTKNWLANVAPTGVFQNDGEFTFQYPSPSGVPQGWLYNPSEDYTEIEYISNNFITGYSGSNDVVAGIRIPIEYSSNMEIECEAVEGTPVYNGGSDKLFHLLNVYYKSRDRRYYEKNMIGIETVTGSPTSQSYILDSRMTTNISSVSNREGNNYLINCSRSTSYVNNQVLYDKSPVSADGTVYLCILQQCRYNPSTGYIFFPKTTLSNEHFGSTFKLKWLKVRENGTLIYDLIPVIRNSNNEVCFYNRVTNTFITKCNECTLPFIAGPIKYS